MGFRRHRRDVDDDAPAVGEHPAPGRAATQECAREVRVQDARPLVLRGVLRGRLGWSDAGARHEDIEAAEPLHDRGRGGLDLLW